MAAYKLSGRTEGLEWKPPMLTFNIERHGGFVNGSTRAEVQKWEVDLDHETASLKGNGRRQIIPMDRRMDVTAIAAEIATIINEQREDRRMKWLAANRVRILTGEVIPATNRQTTTSRRKRFALELERLLLPLGWRRTNRNPPTFERQITDSALPSTSGSGG
jgi:hypothetical protein